MDKVKEVFKRIFTDKVNRIILRTLCILLVTIILGASALYGLLHVLILGPSYTASATIVRTLRETRRGMRVPELFLSMDEINSIINTNSTDSLEEQDTSLIQITISTPTPISPDSTQDVGNTDDPIGPTVSPNPNSPDNDGIEIIDIKGESYSGVLMIVKDPSRIFLGTPGDFNEITGGKTLPEMLSATNAVGGINAGGFLDESGKGNGAVPMGLVIDNGELIWGYKELSYNVVGFDDNYILHVGYMTGQQALNRNLQYAVSFGPVLVLNGKGVNLQYGGLNPRSAIGQRADGAVLMLVINGRQIDSLGATYQDLTNIMLEYGAVNASNLDGGSSSILMYNGEILNVCASMRGPRDLPTAFLVR
ncbi:MAG: phosphodiester glycosidase family protein [Clostridia bacterium]|nr:phosphodiester glycosidase family protein [Clostridia bacterium]